MISIIKPIADDYHLLSELAVQTFMESHGHSAKPEDVQAYVLKTYNTDILKKELSDPRNIYHIIYFKERVAGYSKIVLNSPYPNCKTKNIAKLERIYLLKEFYDLNLGTELLDFNIRLIKENNQAGVWLYVWKENQRAVNFYSKKGFVSIGSYDFKLSETHSNPNHLMLLTF